LFTSHSGNESLLRSHRECGLKFRSVSDDAVSVQVSSTPVDFGSTRFERIGAAIAGAVAVVCGLGAGSLASALAGEPTPITSLANAVIDNAPRSVERWAIDTFGTNDKAVLAGCVIVVLLVAGAIVGAKARRRRGVALVGAGVLALAGVAVTLAGRTGGVAGVMSVLVAAGFGYVVLRSLLGLLDPFRKPARQTATGALDRRRFIGLGSLAAASGVAMQRVGSNIAGAEFDDASRTAAAAELRSNSATMANVPAIPKGADFALEGLTPYRVPTESFYRIDTAFAIPRVDSSAWKLTVGGMVENKRTYTYGDLLKRVSLRRDITLMCVSNEIGGDLVGNAFFEGVPLAELLEEAGIKPGAEQVFSASVDGWTCGFPITAATDGRDSMVALAMNGEPLTFKHGFPARLVIPGIYGYVSATKWLDTIDLLRWDDADGYWIPRGWSRLGPVKTASRIDVPRDRATVAAGPVAIAGVAWAQHRGIDRVEVQVDDNDWQEAELAVDASIDTWRQWKLEWDAAAAGRGSHLISVRATDRDGELQPLGPAPVAPDGAEGYHIIRVKVK
jgi:DMSO/TMAO reductase YedYZ molybdopterin-dependent catalytic subunit